MDTLAHLPIEGQSTDLGMLIYNHSLGVAFALDAVKFRIRKCQKRVHAWADVLDDVIKSCNYTVKMLTLTYARVDGWRPNHIREFRKELRRRCGAGLVAYAWVGELQTRGAVHYHMLAVVKRGVRIPTPDKSGMWKHGSTQIEKARTVYYICRYTGKEYQKSGPFPKGMRMFGLWVSKKLQIELSRWANYRLSSLPHWLAARLKLYFDVTDKLVHARRIGGGGWVDDNNLVYWSPWSICSPELQESDRSKWVNGLRYRFAMINRKRAERIEQNKQVVQKFNDDWEYRSNLAVASHQV